MQTTWLFLFVCLVANHSIAYGSEIVARSRTWAGNISLERNGDERSSSSATCSLDLVAQFQGVTHRLSIKRPETNCNLFGPVQIALSEKPDRSEVLVIVEAMRGGDGDHGGPVLEFFRVDKVGLKKIGETELFSATYVREDSQVKFARGRELFSFCTGCDGRETSATGFNIFVPVKVVPGLDRIVVEAVISETERASIWKRFQSVKASALKEFGDKDAVAALEKRLSKLLGRR